MIEHVSDTALWVAAYRARETERPDALFRDPLAARLAGERGRAIAAAMPSPEALSFAIVIRTVAIDQLIEGALRRGADAVINLGAGLDTRPYRMTLSRELRWVEVDFPDLLEYKEERLRSEVPRCSLERIPADLSDDSQRRALLDRLGSACRAALILTEGVIPYLTADQASRLSRDSFACPGVRGWIQDYKQGRLNRRREQRVAAHLKRAPFRFEEAEPLRFFGKDGWVVRENLGILDVAERAGRRMPFLFPWSLLGVVAPGLVRKWGNATYGYALLEKP